jgi:hypothetical protein
MGLDPVSTGVLHNAIDLSLQSIPVGTAVNGQQQSLASAFGLKDEQDFVLGLVVGHIGVAFTGFFIGMFGRQMDAAETADFQNIIAGRLQEIKRAISESRQPAAGNSEIRDAWKKSS